MTYLSAYLAIFVVNIICDLAWLGTMATGVYRPTLRIDRERPLLAATFNDRLALDTAQLLGSFFALPLVRLQAHRDEPLGSAPALAEGCKAGGAAPHDLQSGLGDREEPRL